METPDYNNPASAGMPYLDKIPGTISPYYNPYIGAGQSAMGNLQSQYGTMINDPASINAKLGAGYQQSPGYQFKLHQALMAGDNAAAAGGMAGSPMHQQNNMSVANGIASQDFNDYMHRVLGLYGQGIEGEQGMNAMGYNASNELGQSVGNAYLSQANMAAQGANSQNQYNQEKAKADSQMWGTVIGLAGGAAGAYFGGPAGAAAGYQLGSSLGSSMG